MQHPMPTVVATAADLFAPPPLPAGLEYREDFLTRDEEARLLAVFADLPFREATFQRLQDALSPVRSARRPRRGDRARARAAIALPDA